MIADAHNHLLMSHGGWDNGEPRVLPIGAMCERLRRGGISAVGLVVGGDRAFPRTEPSSPWLGTLDALAQFWRGHAEAPDDSVVLRAAEDLDRISVDCPGFLLGIEGLGPCFDAPMGDPVAALHLLARLGVRSIQLLGGEPSPAFETDRESDGMPRLSSIGRALIAEADRLGMLIDLSHLSGDEPAFAEVLGLASTAPIASHHSCRTMNGEATALSDDAIRAIADAGGVVGLHTGSHALTGSERRGTVRDWFAHAEHVVDLVGDAHVGLGSDHIDAVTIPLDLPGALFMEGLAGPESFGMLDAALDEHGSDAEARARILGGNVLRVWRAALPKSSIPGSVG